MCFLNNYYKTKFEDGYIILSLQFSFYKTMRTMLGYAGGRGEAKEINRAGMVVLTIRVGMGG